MRNFCSTVQSGVAFLFVFLISVSGQAIERYIDIKGDVEARSGETFNPETSPFQLLAGTKAEIVDFKYIRNGEMAFRVIALNGEKKGQKIWVRDFPSESKFDWYTNKQESWKIEEGPRPRVAAPSLVVPDAPTAPAAPAAATTPPAAAAPQAQEQKETPSTRTTGAAPESPAGRSGRRGARFSGLISNGKLTGQQAQGQAQAAVPSQNQSQTQAQAGVDPKHVIQVLDQATTSISNVGNIQPVAPEGTCELCGRADYPSNFAKCERATNGYYEKDVNRMAVEGSAIEQNLVKGNIGIQRVTNPMCVNNFMTYGADFKYCDAGGSVPAKVSRPCTSEKLFNLTYNSFELAGHCLKGYLPGTETEDGFKRVMELLLAKNGIESSFNTNAVNPTTSAAGIGQFIPGGRSAIIDVNRRELNAMKAKLAAHSNPNCKQIAEKFLNKPMNEGNICTAISIADGNPMKNMLYGMAYYKMSRDELEVKVFKPYAHQFTGLSTKELEQYKLDLAIWAHNAGPGGILYPMDYVVKDIAGERRTSYVELKEMTRLYMQRFPHPDYARSRNSASLIKSTSNYLFDLEKKYANVKKSVPGKKCIL
ncbi:MAG: hypothetical protein AB7O96_10755 [Pseudobdellovibrionaceae bacterium]